MNEAWALAIGSLIAGSGVTWLVTHAYYKRAMRDQEKTTEALIRKVIDDYKREHPELDDTDLVRLFEQGLENATVDGGTF